MPKILVIEDDELVRETFEQILARDGFEVVTAKDGREGLERYAARAPIWS